MATLTINLRPDKNVRAVGAGRVLVARASRLHRRAFVGPSPARRRRYNARLVPSPTRRGCYKSQPVPMRPAATFTESLERWSWHSSQFNKCERGARQQSCRSCERTFPRFENPESAGLQSGPPRYRVKLLLNRLNRSQFGSCWRFEQAGASLDDRLGLAQGVSDEVPLPFGRR
jgi:hypothetical protein